ncbi:MAG: UDP-N-acetylmuramoyl-tripeptide--D-alanyl-D-alanine ligase [Flavobacteriaceae bacterium]|nr:UDP-N-acetylmuramoyl-tripeptide--D-alanyl-D-alanine ligase [Flavobacteriaceae bacterium]
MEIEQLYNAFLKSSGVCTDTRKITPNCFFVALKGTHFNGNRFATDALENGAATAMVDEGEFHIPGKTVLVEDCLMALQKLGTFHRDKLGLPIVALTGSNGKTTTKELIAAVLAKKYRTKATKGNLNNHIGVPLTLLSFTPETEFGVVEMGANHQGEIATLCNIAKPDYGYITNFGKAHLEGFGGIEGVIKGKTEMYRHLEKNDKSLFVNAADPLQLKHTESANRILFGPEGDSIVTLLNAKNELVVSFQGIEIKSQMVGLYNFHNIAAAIAIGHYFNVPTKNIQEAIEEYAPSNNRSQRLQQQGHSILLDAYNANPTSMMAALENFRQAAGSNKTLILGDMFELGLEAAREHQNVTTYLEQNPFATVYLVGENFYKTQTAAEHIKQFKNFEEFSAYLAENPLSKSALLIKGSRGMALERVLDLL